MTTNPPSGPQKRRPLPVVSDVVRELATLSRAEQPDLFKAARQVCAEELSRVKQGFEPASLEIVVQKAARLLDPATLLPAAPVRPSAPVKSLLEEDPFLETTGAIDLKQIWAKKTSSPIDEVGAPGAPFELEAEPAPFVESPSPSAGPDVFVLDGDEEPVPPALGPGLASLAGSEAGPGEDTLRRLSQEAAGVDIRSIVAARAEAVELAETGEDTGSAPGHEPPSEPEEPTDLPPPSLEMPFPLSAFTERGVPDEVPVDTAAGEGASEPGAFETPSLELPVPELPLMELPLPDLPPLPAFPVEMPLQPPTLSTADAAGTEVLDVESISVEDLEALRVPAPGLHEPPADAVVGEVPEEPLEVPLVARASEPEPGPEPEPVSEHVSDLELPPSAYELPPVTVTPVPATERFSFQEEISERPRSRPDIPAPSFGAPERAPARTQGRRSLAPILIVMGVAAAALAGFLYLRSRTETGPATPDGPATSPSTVTETPSVSMPPETEPTAPVPVAAATTATAATTSAAAEPTPRPVPRTAVPERPRPTPTAVRAPAASTAPPEPQPVATKPPAPPVGAPAAPAQKRVATIVTPEWADREPIYVIHFTSYQEKTKADKDVDRLARKVGLTARAVSLDLGEKGIWYRVVLGEYATAEEAMQKRAELEGQGTAEMGFVYRLVGKK